MEDYTKIVFRVTEDFYGYPNPFIENGTIIVLIQDGVTEIGKYEEPTIEHPFPAFSHPDPKNEINAGLASKLEEDIKQKFPEYIKSDIAITLVCPMEIANQIVW